MTIHRVKVFSFTWNNIQFLHKVKHFDSVLTSHESISMPTAGRDSRCEKNQNTDNCRVYLNSPETFGIFFFFWLLLCAEMDIVNASIVPLRR